MKNFFLEGNPNPERIDCPEESTIRALAERRLPVSHPARLHLASCSECFAEFRGFKGDWEQSRRRRLLILGVALAACLIAASAIVLQEHLDYGLGSSTKVQLSSSHIVKADVDLFNAGTVRGGTEGIHALNRVMFPAAVVQLSVVLPRFSEAGEYQVLVSENNSGAGVIAKSSGNSVASRGRVVVDVTLDLRSAKPGPYFLATLSGSDSGMYYYPVEILPGVH